MLVQFAVAFRTGERGVFVLNLERFDLFMALVTGCLFLRDRHPLGMGGREVEEEGEKR